jgi:hypothetical protein
VERSVEEPGRPGTAASASEQRLAGRHNREAALSGVGEAHRCALSSALIRRVEVPLALE